MYTGLMETVKSLILSPIKKQADDSSMMDLSQDDDLFTIEDFENLSSNSKSTGGNVEFNENSCLFSQPIDSVRKRDISPSLPSPKRTALSHADNIPTVVVSDAFSSQEDQKQKEEKKLPSNESLPRVVLIKADLKLCPLNAVKMNRKSNENGNSKDENIEDIQEYSLDKNVSKSKTKMTNSDSKSLKPIRKFKNSSKLNTAVRLTQNNISAEVIEGILFDSLEGELILAEYQKQSGLNPNSQQKLVDILISRSSKELLDLKRLNNYFPKLADGILVLFPNEDRDTYYVAPSAPGNVKGYSKGILIDQWHKLKSGFKKYNMLAITSSGSKDREHVDKPEDGTNTYLTDEVKRDKKWLAKYREPVSEVKKRWEATYKYRYQTRTTEPRCLTQYLKEWPILMNFGTSAQWLINYDFEKTFKSGKACATFLWEKLFNELYNQRSSAVLQREGRMLIDFYKKSSSQDLNNVQLEGLQMLILPYLLPAPNKIETVSGTIKPTFTESANGFVVWSETYQSIGSALRKRNARYTGWEEEVGQPCIVLEGESADCIHSCYVYVRDLLWKITSPLKALDLLFKFFMAFNLKFPVDCTSIWLVIVQILYNVTPDNYKVSPTIQSLCEELQKKLEIGQALEG